ncbi:MAG: hypothetical protein AAGA65_13385 [Actinomycetota bacterium]
MSDATDIAIIDLTNTTDRPLVVNLMVRGEARHIVTLAPGETTRQVTPSGAAWSFTTETETAKSAGSAAEGEVDLENSGGSKGGGRSIG